VISVDPALEIGDVMNLVAKALAHQGPALNFTDESIESVEAISASLLEQRVQRVQENLLR
jgi:hypothetical protein